MTSNAALTRADHNETYPRYSAVATQEHALSVVAARAANAHAGSRCSVVAPCPACLSGQHVYSPAHRGVGQRCPCGARRTAAQVEEARREAIRAEDHRAARCPCKGDLANHDLLWARNELRWAEESAQRARYASSEAQDELRKASERLTAAHAQLRARMELVERARMTLERLDTRAAAEGRAASATGTFVFSGENASQSPHGGLTAEAADVLGDAGTSAPLSTTAG